MTRPELLAAYAALVSPSHHAACIARVSAMTDRELVVLVKSLTPGRPSKRGPRMARHCNDEGVS